MQTNNDTRLTLLATLLAGLPSLMLGLTAVKVVETGLAVEHAALHYAYQLFTTLSLLLIPLALRLMVFKAIKKHLLTRYHRVAVVRLLMVGLVVWAGAVGYVLFLESAMLWTFGIGLVAMFFVWPSRGRRESELSRFATKE